MTEYPRFELPFDIMIHMSDENDICRAADMMRFMQESATRQLERYGPTLAQLKDAGRAFVLSRISIDFLTPVYTYETGRAVTWPCSSSHGATFDRDFIICKDPKPAEGTQNSAIREPAAVAASQWAFLDTVNRKLLRVEDAGVRFTRDETVTTSLPLRFRIPKNAILTPVGEKNVMYSDIDTNGHMNNTHYCDLYCDHLPMAGKRVAALAIAFQKEAVQGDIVSVFRTETPDENGCYFFRTVRQSDGAVNTEAIVKLIDL